MSVCLSVWLSLNSIQVKQMNWIFTRCFCVRLYICVFYTSAEGLYFHCSLSLCVCVSLCVCLWMKLQANRCTNSNAVFANRLLSALARTFWNQRSWVNGQDLVLFVCLFVCLFDVCLFVRLFVCLVGWMVGWSVGWLVRVFCARCIASL